MEGIAKQVERERDVEIAEERLESMVRSKLQQSQLSHAEGKRLKEQMEKKRWEDGWR